jgi:hypothetical protein
MNLLLSEHASEFVERFYSFGDALLNHVQIDFPSRSRPQAKAKIILSCQDRFVSTNEGWINLSLCLEEVTEFRFSELSTFVVIFELHLAWFENVAFLDFGGLTDEPTSVEEFRKSPVYVAAKIVKWETSEYAEK